MYFLPISLEVRCIKIGLVSCVFTMSKQGDKDCPGSVKERNLNSDCARLYFYGYIDMCKFVSSQGTK